MRDLTITPTFEVADFLTNPIFDVADGLAGPASAGEAATNPSKEAPASLEARVINFTRLLV